MRTRSVALLLFGLAAGSARASELVADWNGHFVHLSVAGTFAQYAVERTVEGRGEWQLLEWNPTGCTAECSYNDYRVETGGLYEYRVRALLSGGDEHTFGPTFVAIDASRIAGLEVRVEPHPVVDGTTIHFHLPGPATPGGAARVLFTLVDPSGREVQRLGTEPLPAGRHTLAWDGRDALGRQVPTGMYFYQLEVPGLYETGRVLVLR